MKTIDRLAQGTEEALAHARGQDVGAVVHVSVVHSFRFAGRGGGCDSLTVNPDRGSGGTVFCEKCGAYFPAAQFRFQLPASHR